MLVWKPHLSLENIEPVRPYGEVLSTCKETVDYCRYKVQEGEANNNKQNKPNSAQPHIGKSLQVTYTVNFLLMDTSLKRTPLRHVELVPAIRQSFTSSPSKADTSLRRTVHLRGSRLYSAICFVHWSLTTYLYVPLQESLHTCCLDTHMLLSLDQRSPGTKARHQSSF